MKKGNARTLQRLLSGAGPEQLKAWFQMDFDGLPSLHYAAKVGNTEVVKILLDKGAAVNTVNQMGVMPLHYAALSGHIELVKMLLDKDAAVNTANQMGVTPLHYAAYYGHAKIVEMLLEKGAAVDAKEIYGGSLPLHIAAENGHVKVVEALLEANAATLDAKNVNSLTPLHYAAQNGHAEVVRVLLERGADFNATAEKGITPLHFAAKNGRTEVVRVLLEKGADFNATDEKNLTPLHFAATNGHVEIVKALLEKGAGKNVIGDGYVLLHSVARYGRADVIEVLLDHCKNKDLIKAQLFACPCKEYRLCPIAFAVAEGHIEAIEALSERMTEVPWTQVPEFFSLKWGNEESWPSASACGWVAFFNGVAALVEAITDTLFEWMEMERERLTEVEDLPLYNAVKENGTQNSFDVKRIEIQTPSGYTLLHLVIHFDHDFGFGWTKKNKDTKKEVTRAILATLKGNKKDIKGMLANEKIKACNGGKSFEIWKREALRLKNAWYRDLLKEYGVDVSTL
jgi:ankyrin repeat protein